MGAWEVELAARASIQFSLISDRSFTLCGEMQVDHSPEELAEVWGAGWVAEWEEELAEAWAEFVKTMKGASV